jgi:hypothetical protein
MVFGTALFLVGAGLLHTLGTDASAGQWIGYQILAGFGTGCAQFLAVGVAQQALKETDQAPGLSLVVMFQLLGG